MFLPNEAAQPTKWSRLEVAFPKYSSSVDVISYAIPIP
jgi:hypothetical protein